MMRRKRIYNRLLALLLTAAMCTGLCTGLTVSAEEMNEGAKERTEQTEAGQAEDSLTEEEAGEPETPQAEEQDGGLETAENPETGQETLLPEEEGVPEGQEALENQEEEQSEEQEQTGKQERKMSSRASAAGLSDPRIEADSNMTAKQKVTWDCVWFGSYPQSEVESSDPVYGTLQNAGGWDSKNEITVNGNRYRRMKKGDATYTSSSLGYYCWSDSTTWHYFKYEPIKWRVLKINGNQALLLSDVALDDQKYHTASEDVTWETSTIRSWLNGYGASANKQGTDYSGKNFIGSAFTFGEQSAIVTTSVVNADNISYGAAGGNNTSDKVFLLLKSEVYGDSAAAHGFVSGKSTYDEARRCKSSTYAKAMGACSSTSDAYKGNCRWWLRSPGSYAFTAALVDYDGYVLNSGLNVDSSHYGVRAALNLNLSSNQWSSAGTVCSDGTGEEVGGSSSGGDTGGGNKEDIIIDNSKISIKVADYASFSFQNVEGAKVEVERIGGAVTDEKGEVSIPNSLAEPSAMKRIIVTKDGYRDYIFYTSIVSAEIVNVFKTNRFNVSLKKKKAGDDTNPYISTVMYYRDDIAKTCGGQRFEKSDNVTFRACGIWNDKKPGYYCMYQDGKAGKSFESEDGIFRLNIGDSFTDNGNIYVKMVSADGSESEEELVNITVPEGNFETGDDSYIPILNEVGESGWQTDVPFLHNDKLSFDLGKLKTTIKRDGAKVRIMLGVESSKDIFKDEVWADWKKFCESQPVDLSLSQWSNIVKSDNLDTSWTAGAKIKATGYGWLENDMSPGSNTPMSGGIQVVIDMSTSFKQQYVIGVVPVYMEETIGVNGKLGGEVTFNTKDKKFGGSIGVNLTPSLSVGGGVGVLYAVTIGAEGSASLPMVIDIPKGLTQADLTGSLSIKASVLGFSYSKEFAKATYNLYKAEQKSGSRAKENFEAKAFYEMERYKLPKKEMLETEWYGEQGARARQLSSPKLNLAEKLLQTGTSELTEPVLIQEGDTTLAVFLTEDNSRDVIHRTKLVYTVYDKTSGKWSSPATVDEDGTGDFQPYLSANGGIVVSWLNYKNNITNQSSMEDALQSSEICHAVWNDKSKTFAKTERILSSSASASYNCVHSYMDEKGNITDVGFKNTDTDIFGVSGKNILFMTGVCGNADIEKEFTLSQGIPVSYDVTASNNVVTAAVCIDTDNDLTTLEDRELFLFSSDGSITQLTDNKSFDSSPQYAEFSGNTSLFWYTEESYKMLDVSGKQSMILEDNACISDNYTIVNGENGETALVWSGSDENQVYQLFACIYDKTSGKWSRQIILSDSEESIFRPSGYYNADGNMEFLYRKGSTVGPGTLYALQVAQAPDLEIVDAYIEDGAEVPGKNTKVYVGVRNIGTKAITQYSINVDGKQTNGSVNLLPGEKTLLEADYTVPDTVKNREIMIEISVSDDRDTSNNTFQLTAGYADISVAVTEDEQETGKIVHVTAGNTEAVSAEAVLEVHKNTVDGEILSSMKLGTLKQGEIKTVDFAYQRENGKYNVGADALYYVVKSSAVEKYDSNNYDYSVFHVKENNESGGETEPEKPNKPEEPTNKPDIGGKPSNPQEKPLTQKKPVVKVSKITLSGISKKIAAGKKIKLTAKVTPPNAKNKAVTWKSGNTKVATVNSKGVVTLKKNSGGKKVTITATAKDGSKKKATYKITSMKGVVKKVAISGKKTRTLKAGKTLKLKAKVTASNSKQANKTLKWTSSNTKYATVSSAGKVKTKKAGRGKTVKITAASTDGSNKKVSVKVKLK